VEGRGDIAAAGLTITPERLKKVDFTEPYLTGVDEVIVTNKSVQGLESLDDLSGRKVFVRESSSYYESLLALNDELSQKGLKPVEIVKADETLETEDILEMVNSGAIEITVSDSHIARIWSGVFASLRPV
jgi:ABC-type amino acid transport substrate-binding protein